MKTTRSNHFKNSHSATVGGFQGQTALKELKEALYAEVKGAVWTSKIEILPVEGTLS